MIFYEAEQNYIYIHHQDYLRDQLLALNPNPI